MRASCQKSARGLRDTGSRHDVSSAQDTREKLATIGFDAVGSTPEEFAQWISSEIERWGKVIRDANIAL